MTRAPVICVAHGGGPLPVLGDPSHRSVIASLKTRIPKLLGIGTPNAPRAIVVVTAHWSTPNPVISSAEHHDLYYDYYGFPKEAYNLKYNAPGSPSIAREVEQVLAKEGLETKLDDKRGWDHGVYIPLLLVNPSADIPVIQLSVLESESPEDHQRMGAALSHLRDTNIAIIGSGSASFHNLPKYMSLRPGNSGAAAAELGRQVTEWSATLNDALGARSSEERAKKLSGWREFPHSREMHPLQKAEHFMPLLVCSGAGGDEEAAMFKDEFLGVESWTYSWGGW